LGSEEVTQNQEEKIPEKEAIVVLEEPTVEPTTEQKIALEELMPELSSV
jgi:hypothetical protein